MSKGIKLIWMAAAIALAAGCAKQETPATGSGAWLESLDEGLKEAKAANKMVLVDFGAVW